VFEIFKREVYIFGIEIGFDRWCVFIRLSLGKLLVVIDFGGQPGNV